MKKLSDCSFPFVDSDRIITVVYHRISIDCNLSFFYLLKDDKKAADIFSITDLKVSIKFLFLLHKTPPICIRRQKNPCDFGCLYRLVFRTDFNPDYLIFSRFYLKNRITTKPTSKSLFFNDFNARRGIAISNCNSMVNDGNYPVRVHKGEQRNRATSSRPTTPYLRRNGLTLYQTYYSIAYEHLFVKRFCLFFLNMLLLLNRQ